MSDQRHRKEDTFDKVDKIFVKRIKMNEFKNRHMKTERENGVRFFSRRFVTVVAE